MSKDINLFEYTFIDNKADDILFLLHGTGGDKEDFLFLNDHLHNNYNLVGLKGNVNENGLNRFFKHISFGVFDQENIRTEAAKMKKFIMAWRNTYAREKMYFLGYSNGANMLLATLFYYPDVVQNVILLHPMLPFTPTHGSLDLSEHTIWITNGKSDQMILRDKQLEVIDTLESNKALLTTKEYPSGHEITNQEMTDIIAYLRN